MKVLLVPLILAFSKYFLPAVCLTDTIRDWKDIVFSVKVKKFTLLVKTFSSCGV